MYTITYALFLSVAKQVIDEIITVTDEEIIKSMKFAAEHLKLFLEPKDTWIFRNSLFLCVKNSLKLDPF